MPSQTEQDQVQIMTPTHADQPATMASPAPRRRASGFVRNLFSMSKDKSEARVGLIMLCFGALFLTLSGRVLYLAMGSGRAGRPSPRHCGRHLRRPPRHHRPQRRGARHRRAQCLGLRRTPQDPRQGRGGRAAHRCPARSQRQGPQGPLRAPARLRLGQARDHAAPAGRGPPPRHSGHRLRAREQARLSQRHRRGPCARLRQHRQHRHCRHRKVHRPEGPDRPDRCWPQRLEA
jgi:hypothetical protein